MNPKDKSVLIDEIINLKNNSEKHWSQKVLDISDSLKESKLQNISDIQAEAISNRQLVVDEISIYGAKIWREKQKIKKLEKSGFEFYATSYQVKTSGTEKVKLINADLSDRQYIVDLYDEHVNHLREVAKHFDAINFGVKNKLQALNILGGYE